MNDQTQESHPLKVEPRDPPSRPTSPRRPAKAARAMVAYDYDWTPFDREKNVAALRSAAASEASGIRRTATHHAAAPASMPAHAPIFPSMPRVSSYNPPDWPFRFSTSFEDEED